MANALTDRRRTRTIPTGRRMNSNQDLRRFVYVLLITVTFATAVGRIWSALRVYEPTYHKADNDPFDWQPSWPRGRPKPMPTFGSNDRSRWDTVRALVDHGTYEIGSRDPDVTVTSGLIAFGSPDPLHAAVASAAGQKARMDTDQGIVFEDGWTSVDKVLNPTTLKYYSSKPPLLPTLVAGEYWLLKYLFGWSFERSPREAAGLTVGGTCDAVAPGTLRDNSREVVCVILMTINATPLIVYLGLLARLVERYGTSDWGKLFVMTAGCFGTLVMPFVVTFNNHTVAVNCAMVTLYLTLSILERDKNDAALSGLYVLAGLVAGFMVCNEYPSAAFAVAAFGLVLLRSPWRGGLLFPLAALMPIGALFVTNYVALGQFRPAYSEFGGPWYEYEGGNFRFLPGLPQRGIDWAERQYGETTPAYAFHLLVGHHGLFSLTPIYLLAVAGMVLGAWRLMFHVGQDSHPADEGGKIGFLPHVVSSAWNRIAAVTLVVTVVVLAFYISPLASHNYGGVTNGPRWLLWLTPLWLLTMLPAVDALGRSRWGRGVAVVLLALSIFSASYSLWNPWRHPWIYDLMNARGWIPY
jgi:hypothetical protein